MTEFVNADLNSKPGGKKKKKKNLNLHINLNSGSCLYAQKGERFTDRNVFERSEQ